MKKILLAAAMTLATVSAFAADVGVSIRMGQPGFYGHIDIGDFPQPQVIYPTPVIIQQVPVAVAGPPIYLHVPPGHAKNWRKHCGKYNACGQQVYFVQENWYNNEYAPRYREQHDRDGHDHGNDGGYDDDHDGDHQGKGKGKDKHKDKHKKD